MTAGDQLIVVAGEALVDLVLKPAEPPYAIGLDTSLAAPLDRSQATRAG